ncbi:MAG TPA: L,D-transpeptidase [Gammaproteobacteria bacterium]|nr:L,D-transpeptidase [Gammaproteobacteria bacterium]
MNTPHIEIDLASQSLRLLDDADTVLMTCAVSAARNGPGEKLNSECTPRGWHCIEAKIGEGCPVNTVFVNREPTGEIYSRTLRDQSPGRDWILTRILWLRGLEAGRNLGGDVDTHARYIYLHGTPDEVPMGAPGSRGCIRMRNTDLLALYDLIEVGTRVLID